MNLQEHIDDLIVQCLDGELNKHDQTELRRWIAESAEHEHYFQQRQELWFSAVTPAELDRFDGTRAFEVFLKRKDASTDRGKRHATSYRRLRYAAAVAAAVLISYFSYHHGERQLASSFANVVVEAPEGSRTKTVLPDGTEVWLNAGSRLVYSQGFGLDNRQVSLHGEGYFKVRHHAGLPFCVATPNLQVNDLGTTFNLCDYPRDTETTVSLIEGKVNFSIAGKTGKSYDMRPNQKAVYNKKTGRVDIYSDDAVTTAKWISGCIVLHGQPLNDVVRLLEHSYDVHISIKNARLYDSCHFYGEFQRATQSIEDVLDALAATGKLHYSIQGRQVTLY